VIAWSGDKTIKVSGVQGLNSEHTFLSQIERNFILFHVFNLINFIAVGKLNALVPMVTSAKHSV
jgi:hypothetical protein